MTNHQKEIMEIIKRLSPLDVYRVLVVAQTLEQMEGEKKAS